MSRSNPANDRPLRVAYMGNLDSQLARTWITEMAARDTQVFALTQARPSWDIDWEPIEPREPVIRGLGLGRRDIGRQVSATCMRLGIDLLHSHEVRSQAYWATYSGFHPHVITCWGSDVLRLGGESTSSMKEKARALKGADAVTVGSRSLEDAVVSVGAKRSHCHVIGWGVDTTVYRADAPRREAARAKWGLSDRIVIASTRRHESLYRVDLILEAFARAHASDKRLALLVASDGSLHEQLQAQATDLGIARDVVFTGRLPEDGWPQMADVLVAADVFVSIPESDGGPLSVLEAMACELPVVARLLPVTQEWIEPGASGFLWDGDSTEALGDSLLDAAAAGPQVGHAAREFVVAHHERRGEMDRARELYDRLVARSGS